MKVKKKRRDYFVFRKNKNCANEGCIIVVLKHIVVSLYFVSSIDHELALATGTLCHPTEIPNSQASIKTIEKSQLVSCLFCTVHKPYYHAFQSIIGRKTIIFKSNVH